MPHVRQSPRPQPLERSPSKTASRLPSQPLFLPGSRFDINDPSHYGFPTLTLLHGGALPSSVALASSQAPRRSPFTIHFRPDRASHLYCAVPHPPSLYPLGCNPLICPPSYGPPRLLNTCNHYKRLGTIRGCRVQCLASISILPPSAPPVAEPVLYYSLPMLATTWWRHKPAGERFICTPPPSPHRQPASSPLAPQQLGI